MLKAFNRSSALSPVVSVNSTPTQNGQANGVEQHAELQQSTPGPDGGQTSLALNLDEVHTENGDGASSAAAMNPVFYAGMMLRGHKGDLVRLFELPPTERLLGDYHCAMRKRVLLQGRMYVFDHYVCFYSAVFNFAKKRRIPMRTIKAVRKKKHLGFPNSLEIETDDAKEFFTSFLSREEAYQLIVKRLPEVKRLAEGDDGSTNRRSTDNGSLGNIVSNHTRDMLSPRSASRGGPDGGPRRGGSTVRGGLNGERSLLLTRNSGSIADDDNDDEEDSSSVWVVEPRPAPAVAAGTRHVIHTTLPGSPREFFDVVLADSAPFFEDFLDSQGNRRINLTSWKRHPQLGHVRDMNFTAPIKGAFGNWGVSHTACFQSQRFCLYADEHIVFESSQTMTDIPYGDCFTVDQRWDVRREQDADPERPTIVFDLHVRVPFSSRCLFKSVIESGSVKQVQDTYAQFVEQLRPVMQERLLTRHTLNMEDPAMEPTMSATPRMNSGLGSLAARSVPLARSVAGSVRVRTPSGARPGGQSAFDLGDAGEAGLGLAAVRQSLRTGAGGGVGSGGGEPSVGRLLLSLGGRLAEGARGVLESGVDVVLNLTQCRTTPQMRFLIALVVIMFLANALCMVSYMWHGWAGRGGGGSGAPVPTIDVGVRTAPASLLPNGGAPAAAGPDLTVLLGGAVGADGGARLAAAEAGSASGTSYWVQRMAMLQQEMQLLQGRVEIMSRDVAAIMAHLAQAPAATAGGIDAAAPAGGGGGASREL